MWLIAYQSSCKKIGKSFELQPCLFKQELEHHEIYEDTWANKENEWLPYVKHEVFSTTLSYARYTMGMEELTGFGMKYSLNLLSFSNK